MQQPTLETERLWLREWRPDDAPRLAEIINDPRIFDTTERIPHPYSLEMAEEFIAKKPDVFRDGGHLAFAIELKSSRLATGAVGLSVDQTNRRASLGYWLGVDYWGQGFVTEAAREVLRYGFEVLDLNRIEAQFLKRNPASGRVMAKAGMRFEAEFPKYALKHGVFEDVGQYVIYADEFAASRGAPVSD